MDSWTLADWIKAAAAYAAGVVVLALAFAAWVDRCAVRDAWRERETRR